MTMRFILLPAATLLITICYGQVRIQTQPGGKKYASLVFKGSVTAKYDIVFIGDGFTEKEQPLFNAKVNDAVNALKSKSPYADNGFASFNIWRVNVVSAESGISNPATGTRKRTELRCRLGDVSKGELARCIYSDSLKLCYEAAGYAPQYDAIFVLVNDKNWGGCESNLVFSTIAEGFSGIVTHELGHKIGNLGDEYTCYTCTSTEPSKPYQGSEPTAVNLTKETNRDKIKWRQYIQTATHIPTKENKPYGVVGLFEGGYYYKKGIFRPQFNCQMENIYAEFCIVCLAEMRRRLSAYRSNPVAALSGQ